MIEVQIDQRVPDTIRGLITGGMMETVLDDLNTGAQAEWKRLARTQLGSTRADYMRGIQPMEAEPGSRIIVLVGWLPNAVEQGISGFDMRNTLLGPNSRIRKPLMRKLDGARNGGSVQVGWYANIPFRHKAPGGGSAGGDPMGSAYAPKGDTSLSTMTTVGGDTAAAFGKSVYAAAKRLAPTRTPEPGAKTKWGGRLDTRGMNIPKLHQRHTTNIYQGMAKIRHTYKSATQSQYMTWRRITTTNMEGWHHPGIKARNFAEDVQAWIERAAPAAIARVLQTAFDGGGG